MDFFCLVYVCCFKHTQTDTHTLTHTHTHTHTYTHKHASIHIHKHTHTHTHTHTHKLEHTYKQANKQTDIRNLNKSIIDVGPKANFTVKLSTSVR